MTNAVRFSEADLISYKARREANAGTKSKKRKPSSSRAKQKTELSCHAVALSRLSKCPELKDGGLVRGKRMQANHEHWEQVMIFDYFERTNPDVYEHLAAIPNGGLRSKKTAADLLNEGAKSGYPDMTLDIPRGVYHGMRIELKHTQGGPPSKNQIKYLNKLHKQGYFVCLCYGFEETIKAVESYMKLSSGEQMSAMATQEKWLNKEVV